MKKHGLKTIHCDKKKDSRLRGSDGPKKVVVNKQFLAGPCRDKYHNTTAYCLRQPIAR